MNEEQLLRYSRQINLPQLDVAGQQRLLESRVLIVGAGGLGQPAALYLAGAGVGQILLADDDVAELANLHRQPALDVAWLGESKAEQTVARMRQLNPDIDSRALCERLDEGRMAELLAEVDLALDATDSFASRFALARAAVVVRKPVLSAAVIRGEGQVVMLPSDGEGPCYGCLYAPDVGGEDEWESCAVSGVLGPLAGVMGCLQALQALKYLAGGVPVGAESELLLVDGWELSFRSLVARRDAGCTLCGAGQP